ncbi:MAG: hypothetical protein ABFC96_12800, partial [Thermoguttaceae bacterium]
MARLLRYYGKKRGHRRTGSPKLASVGEGGFFAALLLLGCAGLIWLITTFIVPEWRVNQEFVEATCWVLAKRIDEKPGKDGALYGPVLTVRYSVAGKAPVETESHYEVHEAYSSSRDSAKAILDKFEIDVQGRKNRYPCWYDPVNPRLVVLALGYPWWVWPLFTIPGSF